MVTPRASTISARRAKQRLEAARRQVAALIHADATEIVFTSGGTEADNLAILGAARAAERPAQAHDHQRHRASGRAGACQQLEREGVEVTCLRVRRERHRQPRRRAPRLRPETVLVSIMHANNELGTMQPIAEIAQIAHEAGVLLHVDGVQALGQDPGGRGRPGRRTSTP